MSFFTALFICISLLLLFVYGRMEYYRAKAETQVETIEELERQVMFLSYTKNPSATRYVQENF